MKGKLIFRVPRLVQWSRLLWCRGRKKLWVQKRLGGESSFDQLSRDRSSPHALVFSIKSGYGGHSETSINMEQSSNTKEFSHLFKFGGTWVFLALTVLYSSTKTPAFPKVVCCQHFTTHMVLTRTCFAPLPPLRSGVFPAKRYLWPRKLGIIILNSRGLPFPFCILQGASDSVFPWLRPVCMLR